MTADVREDMIYAELGTTKAAPIFRAYVDVASFLALGSDETWRLLGTSATDYDCHLNQSAAELSGETVARIAVVLGITERLRQVFSDDEAGRRWLRGRNGDAPFSGRSPFDLMVLEPPHLRSVRAYLDGWREDP